MSWLIVKYLLSAAIIVLISETAKYSGKLGGFITALPIVTVSAVIWLSIEGETSAKIGEYVGFTFWYALSTLPMFMIFPYIVEKTGVWGALAVSAMVTVATLVLEAWVLRRFGIELLP